MRKWSRDTTPSAKKRKEEKGKKKQNESNTKRYKKVVKKCSKRATIPDALKNPVGKSYRFAGRS
jgi:hypothetical protein